MININACASFNSADISTSASDVYLVAVCHLGTFPLQAEYSDGRFVFSYEKVINFSTLLLCLHPHHKDKTVFMTFEEHKAKTFLPTEP